MSTAQPHDAPLDAGEALRRFIWPRDWTDLDADEARAFETDRDALVRALWPHIALLFAAAAALWWPLDPLVYAGRPEIIDRLGEMRVSFVVVNVLAFAYGRTRLARRHTLGSTFAFIGVQSLVVGWWVGRLGGLDGQWFSYFCAFPVLTLLFFVGPMARLLALGLMCLCYLAGWIAADPAGLRHIDLPPTLTFLLFVFVMSFYLGHLAFELFRSNVVLRRRLAAKRDELDALAAGLESRVAEQTDDLRRLARRLESVREAERRAVAIEIHDQLGQTLTAIRYGLSFARSRVHDAPDVADMTLGEIEGLTARTSGTVRHLLTLLHPRVLEELGLFEAVRWLVGESTRHVEIEATVECAGRDEGLPEDTATGAFRILQESVTNAIKHASAHTLAVEVRVEPGWLRLAVRDDGVGPAAVKSGSGLGLVGMRERAQTLGGSARWAARPEGGFEVTAALPLPEGSAS